MMGYVSSKNVELHPEGELSPFNCMILQSLMNFHSSSPVSQTSNSYYSAFFPRSVYLDSDFFPNSLHTARGNETECSSQEEIPGMQSKCIARVPFGVLEERKSYYRRLCLKRY